MSASHVPETGGAGYNIDANTIVTADGTVYRQVGSIGDPSTGANIAAVEAIGALAVSLRNIEATLLSLLAGTQHPVSQDALGRLRVMVEAGLMSVQLAANQTLATITTLNTVDLVTNVKNINEIRPGGTSALYSQFLPASQAAWATLTSFCVQ